MPAGERGIRGRNVSPVSVQINLLISSSKPRHRLRRHVVSSFQTPPSPPTLSAVSQPMMSADCTVSSGMFPFSQGAASLGVGCQLHSYYTSRFHSFNFCKFFFFGGSINTSRPFPPNWDCTSEIWPRCGSAEQSGLLWRSFTEMGK